MTDNKKEVIKTISQICEQSREKAKENEYYDPYGNLIDNNFLEVASVSLSNIKLSVSEIRNICNVDFSFSKS